MTKSQKKIFVSKPFYSLNTEITGENFKSKINKVTNFLKNNNSDFIFISAPENVAWLLNIRGHDNPNSPIPNAHLFLDKNKKFYLITKKKKVINLLKEKKLSLIK